MHLHDPLRCGAAAGVLASFVLGCGPIVPAADDGGEGSAGGTGSDDATFTGGADADADASAGDGAGDTVADGGTPVCGNGIVEGDEACDDGDGDDGDGCNVDCRRSGDPLWTVVVDHAPGESTYATRVAISAAGQVFAGVTHFDAGGHGDAELWALDREGGVVWTAQSSFEAEIEQVFGLVASSTGDPSMFTSTILQSSYASVVQTYEADGALRSGVFVGAGSQSYAAASTIDGLDTVITLGLDADTNIPWLEGTDQDGGTRWFTQPSAQVAAVAGVGSGGLYVLDAVAGPGGGYAVGRLDAEGAPLWSTTTPCTGLLAVGADDDVTLVAYADEGMQLCRVTRDGSFVGASTVATVAHAIAATGTDGGDVIVGGYLDGGSTQISPWIGRISAQDQVLWTHTPEVESSSAFVQTVAADEALGIVVAGMSVTVDASYGYLVALTP